MTQLNIATKETGWGPLANEIELAKATLKDVVDLQNSLNAKNSDLTKRLNEINIARRQRVCDLLKVEGRVICLLHKHIFPENGVEESLVLKSEIFIIRMLKTWQTSTRYGDSERDYTDHSEEYDSSACKNCKQVVSRGSFSFEGSNQAIFGNKPPKVENVEDLYTKQILDEISKTYYGMIPVVLVSDLESL